MSRILITGSHGLVGTAMKSMLTSAGHNVRSLDFRAPQGDGGGDVLDLRAVETALIAVDAHAGVAWTTAWTGAGV